MLSIQGYASIFGEKDLGGDIVMPGAFSESLKTRELHSVRFLFQHDPAQLIGQWDKIVEDEKGLWCEGIVSQYGKFANTVIPLLKTKSISGLSIGFKTTRSQRNNVGRNVLAVDLWEISVVRLPMLQSCRIELPEHSLNGGAA